MKCDKEQAYLLYNGDSIIIHTVQGVNPIVNHFSNEQVKEMIMNTVEKMDPKPSNVVIPDSFPIDPETGNVTLAEFNLPLDEIFKGKVLVFKSEDDKT